MKYGAGFQVLTVMCTWMLILMMQSSDAGHIPKRPAAGVSCKPKELTALTKREVEESLKGFNKANGEHLGTWSPGFPELHVHDDSTLNGSKVQCSLLFMGKGLQKVLEDQQNNLNPTDVSLHEKLRNAISSVNNLVVCAKHIQGGECSPEPSSPIMPTNAFEKKQWSHTLLKTARDYLDWLERKFVVRISKAKGKNKTKGETPEATLQEYLEGSGYLL